MTRWLARGEAEREGPARAARRSAAARAGRWRQMSCQRRERRRVRRWRKRREAARRGRERRRRGWVRVGVMGFIVSGKGE
jgi:hypothetical protein